MQLLVASVWGYNRLGDHAVSETSEFSRTLPKNREAEQVLLGAAMLEPETVIPQLLESLQPEDFYWKAHQIVYRCILELFEAGKPADVITVGNRLDELNKLNDIGGRVFLSELIGKVTTTASVPYYAEIIKKKATLRSLIEAGHEIAELGFSEESELAPLLDAAEEKVFQVSRFQLKQNFYLIRDFLHEHLEHLEQLQRDPTQHAVTGLSTGYRKFDEMTAGLQSSDLIVVAARPSVGKTSLALSMGRQMALRLDRCVGFFSLEMTKEQVLERLLCSEARINLHRLRGGHLQTDSESWRRIISAASKLQNSKIIIDDTPSISVLELKSKARRMKAEHGLNALFVDYLQLVEGGGRSDVREQEVAYIARSLKGLARELDIPVIALSQLSRAPERPPRKPRLSDLRECVTGDTHVIDGQTGNWLEIRHVRPGMTVIALDREQQHLHPARVLDVISKGVNQVYRVRTQAGHEIRATAAHPFLTAQGWRPLRNLSQESLIATTRSITLKGRSRPPALCRFPSSLTGDGTYLRHREVGFVDFDSALIQDAAGVAWEHFKVEVLPPSVSCIMNQQWQSQRERAHTALGNCEAGELISRSYAVAERLENSDSCGCAKSDLLWERVVSVVPDGEEHVWDLVVEGVHNFVANGIIVHNSGEIEQTADVVLFLYREDTGSEESSEEPEGSGKPTAPLVHETEIIIGKQRNGPTGSFTLLFHRAYTSFEEYYVAEEGGPTF